MKIELKKITIRELAEGYTDSGNKGVRGYAGRLDIRPPYQREFIYKEQQRNAVINTIVHGFPLNVMYWAERANGTFEVMDGQQRTISICQYINGDFAYEQRYFDNLQNDEQEQILNYELMVYQCNGTDSEELQWFKTINIAGEKLTDQELRNAVYAGKWVSDAKRYFSKNGCPAYDLASKYMSGSPIRQDYLETAIGWIANDLSDSAIANYMATHQNNANANELWFYFTGVINWVQVLFPRHRREMQSVQWGLLYNKLKDKPFDAKQLEQEVSRLMQDDDVTKKSGIYEYVLTGNERVLNIRAFTDNMKREAYERQQGVCPHCHKEFDFEFMEADHIVPWCKGGRTLKENCQMLCRECNRRKSGK